MHCKTNKIYKHIPAMVR